MLRECFFNGNLAAYIEWVVVCVCVRVCVRLLLSGVVTCYIHKWCVCVLGR